VLPASAGAHEGAVLPAVARPAEIPRVSEHRARVIIAETGLDTSRFPAPGHLLSRAGLVPVAAQSGTRASREGHGTSDTTAQAVNGAAKTRAFLGERPQRVTRRRGKAHAQVAVARSILVIIWRLLADPAARYADLGHDITIISAS
jgi:transposase